VGCDPKVWCDTSQSNQHCFVVFGCQFFLCLVVAVIDTPSRDALSCDVVWLNLNVFNIVRQLSCLVSFIFFKKNKITQYPMW
jgi:hypothetical protein